MAAQHLTPIGTVFSRLTVIGNPFRRANDLVWCVLCRCECGNEKEIPCRHLPSGVSRSCGCLARELTSERASPVKTHGHAWNRGERSPTYINWRNARDRCLNPRAPNYSEYGGRGIRFCDRWNDFTAFLSDMGERPDGMTLDRYPDVDGNYEPGNCRWATPAEQAANRRNSVWIEVDGVKTTTATVAKQIGIDPQLLRWRLNHGWSVERAISTPTRNKSPKAA